MRPGQENKTDTLLRTVQQHHAQLSLMADTKASILITISSIIITVTLSRTLTSTFIPALMTLGAFCLLSLILAAIAVLPTFENPTGATRNIFFFGHFARMTEADFVSEVSAVLADDDARLEAALRDIFTLGVFLYRKKYRYLRYAYIALIAGFIAAAIVEAFVLVLV